jgi:hypothetical protein
MDTLRATTPRRGMRVPLAPLGAGDANALSTPGGEGVKVR